MHIVVFGAGGVGGYFGGRLAQSGQDVTFIARGQHLEAMLRDGLVVSSIKGDFVVRPVSATDDTTRVTDVDAVLVCVKAWDISKAAKAIIPMLGPDTFVVPLENGVEAPSQLAEILGREHVLGGLCRIASHIASPGHIQHTGLEPYVAFGELDKRLSARTQDLMQAFEGASVWAEIPLDISIALWMKYLFISSVSAIGAVTRVSFGEFRSQPETRAMLEKALQDCYSVALAQGILMPPDCVATTLAYIDTLPHETLASMQRDVMDGRPSELDAQIGALVRMGEMYNVPTPLHTIIYHSLLPQERLARAKLGQAGGSG